VYTRPRMWFCVFTFHKILQYHSGGIQVKVLLFNVYLKGQFKMKQNIWAFLFFMLFDHLVSLWVSFGDIRRRDAISRIQWDYMTLGLCHSKSQKTHLKNSAATSLLINRDMGMQDHTQFFMSRFMKELWILHWQMALEGRGKIYSLDVGVNCPFK